MITPERKLEIEYDKIDPELVLIKLKEILAIIQRKKREKIE